MRPSLRFALVPAALAGFAVLAPTHVAGAQGGPVRPATAPAPDVRAPEVGAPAPAFTLATAGASGAQAPVSLAGLRGKVVVLAFYPKDKTSGCTAELTKFRDDYAALFGPRAGANVVVVPVSADGLASHAAWAAEAKFPFALASDSTLAVADQYGSRRPGAAYSNRTVFVIGKDGTVKYRDLKFNALSQDAYAQLAAAVRQAAG